MGNSSEAPMRQEKKVSRRKACVSYMCFYRSLTRGSDLKGQCSGSPEIHRNCEGFQHFAGKGCLVHLFLNQLGLLTKPTLSTSATAEQDPDMLVGQWVGKKKREKWKWACLPLRSHGSCGWWIPAETPLPNWLSCPAGTCRLSRS